MSSMIPIFCAMVRIAAADPDRSPMRAAARAVAD
jgi:hypothetical protein